METVADRVPDRRLSLRHESVWNDYWSAQRESVFNRLVLEAEARDFVARLSATVTLKNHHRVLDFGCGPGHVAQLLAPNVGQLWLWDTSASVRMLASRAVSAQPHVKVIDDPATLPPGYFDLIIVNSVVQYMSLDEFESWLQRWPHLLCHDGRLVISDILPPEASAIHEVWSLLTVGMRRRLLIPVLMRGISDLRRYVTTRRERPLLRLTPADVERLAERVDLETRICGSNLTHRTTRLTVMLRRRASPQSLDGSVRPLAIEPGFVRARGSGVESARRAVLPPHSV